jgi:4-aminobutyrate aminotransferase-like enzyme
VGAEFGAKARYFNTFGGNAVAAAVAMEVLRVIEDEGLVHHADVTGASFAKGLRDLAARHPDVLADVRGAGLFLAADIRDKGQPSAAAAARIVNRLRDRRVLISATGPDGATLKIRPPLPFSTANVDQFLSALAEVLTG